MTTTARQPLPPAGRLRERFVAFARTLRRPQPELLGLIGLAALLNLWALSRNGWANTYYSAAVRSMSTNWHDFLYGSFDASGVMTVDKPPLALWVQALSVRVFGFDSLSILVPQAIMGVVSVVLVYDLVRRHWGRVAGTVAGLAMATTPIAVAVSRHNNPDALLVLCSTAALWFVLRALEDGRTRWLVWAGVCVGLGFETKMGAALLVLPGLAAAWMWVAPRGRIAALKSMAAAGGAMIAVGLAWPLLVALTPSADRPWVSGTGDNSIWSLILNYNGLGRLDGQAGAPAAAGGGGGGGFFGGGTGPLRLLNASLGGQAGWLIGLAVVGGVGIAVASRLRRSDPRTGWIIAVGGSFLVPAIAFSMASGIFHPYYVSLLAPFTAALVGGTIGQILKDRGMLQVLGPLALAGGVLSELVVLHNTAGQPGWLAPLVLVAGGAGVAGLVFGQTDRMRHIALVTAMSVLMIAPVAWSFQTLGHATSGTFPAGGPETTSFGGPGRGGMGAGPGGGGAGMGTPPAGVPGSGGITGVAPGGAGAVPSFRGGGGAGAGAGGFGGDDGSLTEAAAYAAANGGGTVVTSSQSGAATAIISSGDDVAGLGGFSGRESEVSVSWLADAVAGGKIRWVMASSSGAGVGFADGRTGATTAMNAVENACVLQTDADSSAPAGLYDCQGAGTALAALATTTSS